MSCHGILILATVAWMVLTDRDLLDAYRLRQARLADLLRAIARGEGRGRR